ncbi:MAG: leucyl aminopeptidase family protein [Alphaproteobacteria bacterium]|nr:MAG: leucyl aminopeptidase family protein [Alphaproteobacteria bacterium]
MAIEGLTSRARKTTVPLVAVSEDGFEKWLSGQPARIKTWARASGFKARPGAISLLAAPDGALERVFLGLPSPTAKAPGTEEGALWAYAACPFGLPEGSYRLDRRVGAAHAGEAALGWALGSYRFTRYRKPDRAPARLVWPPNAGRPGVENAALATFLVRDLINTPAGDMGPSHLAAAARRLGRQFGARVSVITGARLLDRNYPAIHAVGRAAADPPRLIDLHWRPAGRRRAPMVVLCGKGVCFDTGGLDLKSTAGIKLMKKDMGGAAQALGLARMIMAAGLPIRLRVLIPAVENAVAGNAYHPLDVISTRLGLSVEVGNTDAEGRIVLADALAEACRARPDLLIDMATLTGAARVALGTDLPALFCNDDGLAEKTLAAGRRAEDPLWRLPLWAPYRDKLDSRVADINNISPGAYGGAITAALFLQEFVTNGTPWIHVDFMGWNETERPGRPEGGEAQGMRALFALIEKEFCA